MAGTTKGSRGGAEGEDRATGRVTIASIDNEVLGELKGFLLFLAQKGGVDGMRTIGDVVARALTTGESLPEWRKKYNKGRKFPSAAYVPPGRK